METILVGKNGTVEHIAQPLLKTLERCLCRLVNDEKSTPKNITDGLWYVAAIVDRIGPPLTIVKNPYEG